MACEQDAESRLIEIAGQVTALQAMTMAFGQNLVEMGFKDIDCVPGKCVAEIAEQLKVIAGWLIEAKEAEGAERH